MVVEVAADHVVLVADAAGHLAVEVEQQPGVLDAAAAEAVGAGA